MKLSRIYLGVSIAVICFSLHTQSTQAATGDVACSSGSCYTINESMNLSLSDYSASGQCRKNNTDGLCYVKKTTAASAITPTTFASPTAQNAANAAPSATDASAAAITPNFSSTTATNQQGNASTTSTSGMQYTQLENIPGYEGKTKTFPEYVVTIYNFALWIVGISALFMLTVGGFMYLTSAGNTSSANTAKGLIKDALIGLVLGLSAWLIVNTINPDLTTMNVSGLTSGTPTPSAAGGQSAPSQATTAAAGTVPNGKLSNSGSCKDASGKAVSPASNIAEAKSGQSMTACAHGCDTSGTACSGKVNPSPKLVSALNDVPGNYTVTSIAGGSHELNSAHYLGNAIDIAPTSNNKADWVTLRDSFISKGGALSNNPDRTGTFCETKSGAFSVDCAGADHIHVRF